MKHTHTVHVIIHTCTLYYLAEVSDEAEKIVMEKASKVQIMFIIFFKLSKQRF